MMISRLKIPRERPTGQGVDFRGAEAEAQDIIQEEVVERVGAHQILGLLGDFALGVRGQQLRADGGVQNVLKHRLRSGAKAGISEIASIIQRISVLGMEAFTPYMLMWSPL